VDRLRTRYSLNMAIAVDGTATENISIQTNASWSHTVTSNTNGLLIVAIAIDSDTVSGVTYNGDPMTEVVAIDRSGVETVYIYSLKIPDTGNNTVQVTNTNGYCGGFSMSFTGVDQTTPIENTGTATGSASPITQSINTTTDGAIVLDCYCSDDFVRTFTVGADQTERWKHTANVVAGGGSTEPKASAGAVTMSWTISSSETWAQAAVVIKPAGAGATIVKDILGRGIIPFAR